jgi:hypothetical protein
MLHQAEDGDSLVELQKAVATLLHAAERQERLRHRHFEVAVINLEVQRKIGAILLQTDARGGDRANSQAGTLLNSGLPSGLKRSSASRCRGLARIEKTAWNDYLVSRRSVSRIPSAEGAVNFAKSKTPSAGSKRAVRKKSKSRSGDIEVSPQALDALERCLGDIDVCVGDAAVNCRHRLSGAKLATDDLSGTVFINARVDPDVWLKRMVELKSSAQCRQVVILLRTEPGHSWLSHFSGDPWHLCFLEGAEGPVVAAFIGVRTEGFFAGMHDHGLVVSVHT